MKKFFRCATAAALPLALAAALGARGRDRAVTEFSWDSIAAQTADLYAQLVVR